MNLEVSSSPLSYLELEISHILTKSSVWTCCDFLNDVIFSLINQIAQKFLIHLVGSNHMGPLLSSLFLCPLFFSFWKFSGMVDRINFSHCCLYDSLVGWENFSLFSYYWFLCCPSSSLILICFAIVHHICFFSSNNPFQKCLVLKWMQYCLSVFCVRLRAKTSHANQTGIIFQRFRLLKLGLLEEQALSEKDC